MPESYKSSSSRINEANDEIARLKAENERLRAQQENKTPAKENSATDTENNAVDLKSLSYDELKAKAAELGLEFKANVKKADLIKMIEDAQAKAE